MYLRRHARVNVASCAPIIHAPGMRDSPRPSYLSSVFFGVLPTWILPTWMDRSLLSSKLFFRWDRFVFIGRAPRVRDKGGWSKVVQRTRLKVIFLRGGDASTRRTSLVKLKIAPYELPRT